MMYIIKIGLHWLECDADGSNPRGPSLDADYLTSNGRAIKI
jgi:hypothetical protein